MVFGCGTSLADEAVVKFSSLFGTSGGLSVLRGYALYDPFDIYRTLSPADVLTTIAAAPILLPRTIARRFRQAKLWPRSDFGPLLDRPFATCASNLPSWSHAGTPGSNPVRWLRALRCEGLSAAGPLRTREDGVILHAAPFARCPSRSPWCKGETPPRNAARLLTPTAQVLFPRHGIACGRR
ncbi:MAG: hypothetical protein ACREEG_10175 [Phenylobacterium sp.]